MCRWTAVERVVVVRSRQCSTAVLHAGQLRSAAAVFVPAAAAAAVGVSRRQAGVPELRSSSADVVAGPTAAGARCPSSGDGRRRCDGRRRWIHAAAESGVRVLDVDG